MVILKGTYIENLTLENNSVEGSLWSMWPDDIDGNLRGTVRIVNNESIGNVLFRARSTNNAIMPVEVLTFFSGNVSNGKKTDIGNTTMQLSQSDGLLFNGRTFFNTILQKEAVFLFGHWCYTDYQSQSD